MELLVIGIAALTVFMSALLVFRNQLMNNVLLERYRKLVMLKNKRIERLEAELEEINLGKRNASEMRLCEDNNISQDEENYNEWNRQVISDIYGG